MKDTNQKKFNKELTAVDKQILTNFKQRRINFDIYIRLSKKEVFTCPSCGYPTLSERSSYEICVICDWEDDGQDDEDADVIWGGPNYDLSLTQSRLLIGHELQKLADDMCGTIITDPQSFFSKLKEHDQRMEIAGNKINGDTDVNDPRWEEWRQKRVLIKNDLIERKE